MDLLTLQMAKNYTNDTVEGMGIQKGKNCQIQNIEDITGGHRITFAWYDEDQVLQTDTVDIMDGPEGPEGPQGPQGEVGESGVGFGPVPEVMPEGVNWWIDPNGEPNTAATINDANVSEDETWSSKKIDSKFGSNNIWDGVEEAGIINTSTGEDEESTNGRRMPHDKGIAVVPGDTYYIKKTTTAKIRYTFYAADGTYIGNEDALGNTLVDTNVMSQKMIPPAGATQFRAFASSSMVNAGLTVPAGVGADIDEINGEISQINRDLAEVLLSDGEGAHNSHYRGKFLGGAVSTEQYASISNGTFKDLYIGDYWTIAGVNYRIAHFDYWLRTGSTECTKHHILVVPDSPLYTAKMNDTNTTTGAYVGSKMYQENLAQAITIAKNAFGSSNILTHRGFLATATKATSDPSYETGGAWYDSQVELMNERMVYGADIFHNIEANGVIPFAYTIDRTQLALFNLAPSKICIRENWWLRDVVSSTSFANVNISGYANESSASANIGVRPVFGITA